MSVNRALLPTLLYTAEQTRALDRCAIEQFGIPGIRLMQRAGHAVFAEILERYPHINSLTIYAGAGNNGGDGFVIAQLARQKGWDVQLICVGNDSVCGFAEKLTAEAKQAWQLLQQPLQEHDAVAEPFSEHAEIRGELIVDALLGTGLSGEVRGAFSAAITQINASGLSVFAVDLPSGICADTGRVLGCAVKANTTLSFIGLNRGLLTHQAVDYCGQLLFDDLKVPEEVYLQVPAAAQRTNKQDLQQCLPQRPRSAHKGRHGHVLVLGGNHHMGGAALMAAEAALRSGAGLVSLATRKEHVTASLVRIPEVMAVGVESAAHLAPLIERADVIVIGPGLGKDAWAQQMLQAVLRSDKPLVLDADALNLMASKALFDPQSGRQTICTPHPGEAARILNCSIDELSVDRFTTVRKLQQHCGGAVILKGAGSLSYAGTQTHLCNHGNPGMGVAGMGDVLSGICGALLAQKLSLEDAARIAVYIHAKVGDYVVKMQGEIGLMATDLCSALPKVINV